MVVAVGAAIVALRLLLAACAPAWGVPRPAPPRTTSPWIQPPRDRRDARLGPPPLPHPGWRRGGRERRGGRRRAARCSRRARAPADRRARCRRWQGPAVDVPPGAELAVAGITPIVVPTDRVLPHRHRVRGAARGRQHLDADHQGHGRPRGGADLRPARRDAPVRAVRDHRLRLQRGRRQARRQRPVARRGPALGARDGGRPGGRHPDRGPLRGRLHGRLPDRLGHGPVAPRR